MLLILAGGYSCNVKQHGIKKDVQAMLSKQIEFPPFQTAVLNGKDTILPVGRQAGMAKMIIYYDSLLCSSCKLSRLSEWGPIVAYSRSTRQDFIPVFIFSPSAHNRHNFELALRGNPFDTPIYVDDKGEFLKLNSFVPQNHMCHVMLVDKNNRVLLVGNPLENTKLWDLYYTTIRELIYNKGTLPAAGDDA